MTQLERAQRLQFFMAACNRGVLCALIITACLDYLVPSSYLATIGSSIRPQCLYRGLLCALIVTACLDYLAPLTYLATSESSTCPQCLVPMLGVASAPGYCIGGFVCADSNDLSRLIRALDVSCLCVVSHMYASDCLSIRPPRASQLLGTICV